MGLTRVEPGRGIPDGQDLFSVYDGSQFVFTESSWSAVTMLRMLWRYGLAPYWFKAVPRDMFQKFLQIYTLQANFSV